jgi:hypothetical protein
LVNNANVVVGSPDHYSSEEKSAYMENDEDSDYDSEKERNKVLQKSLTPVPMGESDTMLLSKMN